MSNATAIDSRFTTVRVGANVFPDHRVVVFPEPDGSWLAALYQRNQTGALQTMVPDTVTSEALANGNPATRDGQWVISDDTGTEWSWPVTPPPSRGG